MEPYTITAELNLKKIIAELREFAEALDEFADNLDKLEKKYSKSEKKTSEFLKPDDDKLADPDEYLKHSDNGFPYFMTERTEDDLEESEDEEWQKQYAMYAVNKCLQSYIQQILRTVIFVYQAWENHGIYVTNAWKK